MAVLCLLAFSLKHSSKNQSYRHTHTHSDTHTHTHTHTQTDYRIHSAHVYRGNIKTQTC